MTTTVPHHLESLMPDTTPTTSADLWAAAGRAHDLGDPLHLALARWLKDVDAFHQARVCVDGPEGCTCTTGCQWCGDEDWPCADTRHALAVARLVLGTTDQQPTLASTNTTTSYRLEHRHREETTWRPNTPGIGANWSWQSREKADQRLAEARDRWPDFDHRLITINTTVTEAPTDQQPATAPDEVADLRAELDKLIRWHKEDGTQAAKMRTTITRLRTERAELGRQLDCIRGDVRDMEAHVREQDAEFERLRRLADEAQQPCVHPQGYEGECPCPTSCVCCTATAADEAQQPEVVAESCGRFVPDTPRAPGLCASCGDARGWHSREAVEEQPAAVAQTKES